MSSFVQELRAEKLPRTSPFGVHTQFATELARLFTEAKLTLLRIVKPERDARSLGSLHFAYWTLIPRKRLLAWLPASRRARDSAAIRSQMLFMSEFSGDWEDYLMGFNRRLLSALDTAWGDSVGWRPKMEAKHYLEFVRHHEVETGHHFQAYGEGASVHDVRAALEVSEQLERFASEAGGLEPEAFDRAYRELCTRLGNELAV